MFAQTFLSFVSSSFLRTLSEHFSLPLFYRTIKSPLRNYINQRDVSPPRCIASLIAPRFAASSPSLGLGDSYTTWRTYVTVVNCDRSRSDLFVSLLRYSSLPARVSFFRVTGPRPELSVYRIDVYRTHEGEWCTAQNWKRCKSTGLLKQVYNYETTKRGMRM